MITHIQTVAVTRVIAHLPQPMYLFSISSIKAQPTIAQPTVSQSTSHVTSTSCQWDYQITPTMLQGDLNIGGGAPVRCARWERRDRTARWRRPGTPWSLHTAAAPCR